MGRRTGVRPDETRQQLLDAAMAVLLRRGFQGTRVSEIAREAGVTSGAIYNHFSSKAELLTEAIAEQGPDAIGELLAASNEGPGVIPVLRDIGAHLGAHAPELAPVVLELVVTSRRDESVATVVTDTFVRKERDAVDVMRLAQECGEVDRTIDPEALARFTTMLALGSLVTEALGLKAVDPDAWSAVIDRALDSARPPTTATLDRAASADQEGSP